MNQQISNALKNLLTQDKNDFKAFQDEVEAHMLKPDPDMTKLAVLCKACNDNKAMIRSLVARLWTT